MSICITFFILIYPYTELPLFFYIVLNSPDVRDFIARSLNLVRTVPKKLYIFSYTHSSVRYTFYVPTHIINNLFVYLSFTCVRTYANFTLDLPSCIINHFLSTCLLVNPLLSTLHWLNILFIYLIFTNPFLDFPSCIKNHFNLPDRLSIHFYLPFIE